jgi:hypothetical protein
MPHHQSPRQHGAKEKAVGHTKATAPADERPPASNEHGAMSRFNLVDFKLAHKLFLRVLELEQESFGLSFFVTLPQLSGLTEK